MRGRLTGFSVIALSDSNCAARPFVWATSRNERWKKKAHITPSKPNRRNVFRHDNQDITQMTSNGVNAPPQRALNQRMACARVRSLSGNQIMNALVRLGKQPASPMPKKNLVATNEAKFQTHPVAAVKTDHMITTRISTLRGPIQSPSQPPGISKSAYAQANAENASPSWAAVRPSSPRRAGAA